MFESFSLATGDRLGKKRQAHRDQVFFFLNNCIVFKVQDFFMYKNTVVLASTPPKKKREQKKGTNSGEESEKSKAKYRTERVNLQGGG